MKQVFNLKSNFWRNVKLSLNAALVVLTVFGFVFIMYLDLTNDRIPVKKVNELQQQEEVIVEKRDNRGEI